MGYISRGKGRRHGMFWVAQTRRSKRQRTLLFLAPLVVFFATLGYGMDNSSSTGIQAGKYMGKENNQIGADNPNQKYDSLVLIGASFAAGWNPGRLAGLELINKGIGGEQSSDMLVRFERDVIDLNPRAVIIWGFINDIFGSNKEKIEETNKRALENLKKMVTLALEARVIPILATEVTIRPPSGIKETITAWVGSILGKEGYHKFVNKQVVNVNKWVREFAQQQKVILFDFQTQLADESGMRDRRYAVEDGSHLSPAAYARLTAYSEKILESLPTETPLSNQGRRNR